MPFIRVVSYKVSFTLLGVTGATAVTFHDIGIISLKSAVAGNRAATVFFLHQ